MHNIICVAYNHNAFSNQSECELVQTGNLIQYTLNYTSANMSIDALRMNLENISGTYLAIVTVCVH